MGWRIYLTFFLLLFFSNNKICFGFEADEFHCKAEPGGNGLQYKICRKCPTLEESCERPSSEDEECKCDNIQLGISKIEFGIRVAPFL
jgi:hypothetical protein